MQPRRLLIVVLLAAGALGVTVARATPIAATAPAASHPLVPGIFDPFAAVPPSPAEVAEMKKEGVDVFRLTVNWSEVAPKKLPKRFTPTNPDDTHYRWPVVDKEIKAVVADGFQPIVDIIGAPTWASAGPAKEDASGHVVAGPDTPDAAALGQFALAIAKRYSGTHDGLVRVRYWQVFNEPNYEPELSPQYVNGVPASPGIYRRLVNAAAASIHSVHSDNLVIAGALTPFTYVQNGIPISIGPLEFMRDLLCMSGGAHPHPTCKSSVSFDVWAHHPYTSGGPTHKAALANDVSLGNLSEMKTLLDAAAKARHIVSRKPPQFWVTEFSWDSSPPDPKGVPLKLLESWVPQAMYQMWRNGVSVVAWFSLNDFPLSSSSYQSGLYFNDGTPKPYLEGFRFPVVAFRTSKGFKVWGRTPGGKAGTVTVEQRTSGAWRTVGTLATDTYGIFQHTYAGARTGTVRAVLNGEDSLPFPLAPVPDKTLHDPFGS
ncbi:MAG TPA: hypothetical protein VFW85_11040 [Gaiellaceae bacterium]|nr:hypothetical protein [Gaiellaceae bacterium]